MFTLKIINAKGVWEQLPTLFNSQEDASAYCKKYWPMCDYIISKMK